MKILRLLFVLVFLALTVVAYITLQKEEKNTYYLKERVNYPVEKVFPQFTSLQNFTQWIEYFRTNDLSVSYYTPYEGKDSSIEFYGKKNQDLDGELFIRYVNPLKTVKYQFFTHGSREPYALNVSFKPSGSGTEVTWKIDSPQRSRWARIFAPISDEDFLSNIKQSMKNLNSLLGGKMDREIILSNIDFDTITVETQKAQLLVGVAANTMNKAKDVYSNVIINHNKVLNFVQKDMKKKPDEFGLPVLVYAPSALKDKEFSYFYGVAVPSRVRVNDNNFIFRDYPQQKVYVKYFKGAYNQREKTINELTKQLMEDSLQVSQVFETILQEPQKEKESILKISVSTK